MLQDTSQLYGDQIRSADVCVIGSGPGGSTVARELAEQGMDVILLESGGPLNHKVSTRDIGPFLTRYLKDAGMRVMLGNAFVGKKYVGANSWKD